MAKKHIVITLSTLLSLTIGLAGLGVFLQKVQKGTTPAPSQAKMITTNTVLPFSPDERYEDQSGFSFDYPKDVVVKDVTPPLEMYYSRLELVYKGNLITIEIKDVPSEPFYENVIKTLPLAGVNAKQSITQYKTITSAYSNGIEYLFELHTQDRYMTKVYDHVLSSFTIKNMRPTNTSMPPDEASE